VSVRAHGVDQYGNPAHVEALSLKALLRLPDGSHVDREVVDTTQRRATAKDGAAKGQGRRPCTRSDTRPSCLERMSCT